MIFAKKGFRTGYTMWSSMHSYYLATKRFLKGYFFYLATEFGKHITTEVEICIFLFYRDVCILGKLLVFKSLENLVGTDNVIPESYHVCTCMHACVGIQCGYKIKIL